MNNPNTYPAAVMVYGGAPSLDDATAPNPFADLRAGLDAAKRLREHLPGDTPELQQADDTIAALEAAIGAAGPESAPLTTCGATRLTYDTETERITARSCRPEVAAAADLAQRMAMIDELATLRADNDARGALIEQLRAKIVSMEANMRELMDESDKYMWERDEARQDLANTLNALERANERADAMRSERDITSSELIALRGETHRELSKLDNVRRDRDKYFAAYQRTLRALNAALGEP